MFIIFWVLFSLLGTHSYVLTNTKNFTPQQWQKINYFLNHPDSTPMMINQLKKKIFCRYLNWSTYQAVKFKKFHRYKCRNLNVKELGLYAQIGLYKAVKKYNGKYPFYRYANIHIQGQLYKGLTDLFPITSVSKKERRSKKNINEKNMTTYLIEKKYKKRLESKFVGIESEWMFDKLQKNNDNDMNDIIQKWDKLSYLDEIWNKIQFLEPFPKRIFTLKYNADFDKIRSNKEISILMGCSEEYIRITIKRNIEKIIQK